MYLVNQMHGLIMNLIRWVDNISWIFFERFLSNKGFIHA